jgi:YVTN family beta-propeller protein
MEYAHCIGRVGALAVALGVGAAVANTPGVALADPSDSSSSSSADASSSSSGSSADSSSSSSGAAAGSPSSSPTSGTVTSSESSGVSGGGAAGSGGDGRDSGVGGDESKGSDSSQTGKKRTAPTVNDKQSGSDAAAAAITPKKPKRSVASARSEGDKSKGEAVADSGAAVQPKSEPVTPAVNKVSVVDVAPQPAPMTAAPVDTLRVKSAPQSMVKPLASMVLSAVGLAPSADGGAPQGPGDSPLLLAGLAAFRRQTQHASAGDEALAKTTAEPSQSSLMLAAADTGTAQPMVLAAVANSAPVVGVQPTGIPDPVTGVVKGTVVATDGDGNTLSYGVTGTSAGGGQVSINSATGAYTYIPSAAQRLAAGATTGADTDTFTVSVSDGQSAAMGTVPVYVSPTQLNVGTPIAVQRDPASVAVYQNTTYVINQYDKSVSVIDTNPNSATFNRVVSTIKLASSPSDIVLNSTGTRAYVAMKGNASVAVLDTQAKTVITNVKVGSTPAGIAISPDNSRVYVTNGGSSTVSVIDTTLNKEISRITVGSQPSGVAVSPDGQRLYVTLRYTDSLAVVNLADNTKTLIKVGDSPREVAVTPDGKRAYVTNYDGTVSVIDTTTKAQLVKIATGGPKYQPAGVAISPDGAFAYVANGKDTVSVINTKTNTTVATLTIDSAAENGAHTVAVSPDGTHVYVTDYNDDTLRVLSLTRGNTAPVATAAPTLGAPDPTTGAVAGSLNVVDPDGDALSYTVTGQPAKGTVSVNTAGGFTYTPTQAARDQAAQTPGLTDTFTITASDSQATKPVSLTVAVLPSPPPPPTLTAHTTTISVGTSPVAMAISGNRAYVVNQGINTVSVINTATNQVTATIPMSSYSSSVAASPDGSHVYVANHDTVSVIDTATNQVTATIPIPDLCEQGGCYGSAAQLTNVFVSPDGSRVYAARSYSTDDGSPTGLSVINTATNTVINTDFVYQSQDMTFTPDGTRIYSADSGQYVGVLDPNGLGEVAIVAVTTTGNWPYENAVAINPTGTRAYVVVDDIFTAKSRVAVIDTNPTSATYNTEIASISVPDGAQDVVVSPDGTRVYVTEGDGKTVTVIDAATNTVLGIFTTDQTSGGYVVRSIAVGPNGAIYVTDSTDGKIYVSTVDTST